MSEFRANNLPENCPTSAFSNRTIQEVFRLVESSPFNDLDFLSPLEKNPRRQVRNNLNSCLYYAVSIGSYKYCLENIKKHPKNFGNCHIAVGKIDSNQGVCDEGNYHINFFPYEAVEISREFTIYELNSEIKERVGL